MIVVYQSLESVGHKDSTAHSVLSGNSFKHLTQKNAGKVYDLDADSRKHTYSIPFFDLVQKKHTTQEMEVEFATDVESKAMSKKFKGSWRQGGNELEVFLEGVIDTIVKSTLNRTCVQEGFGSRPPEIIVLGELYGEDLKGKTFKGYQVIDGMNPTGDSRHRFTVLKNEHSRIDRMDLKLHSFDGTSNGNKNEKAVCMTLEVMGWLMAFVHIPNEICKEGARVVEYLKNNAVRSTGSEELDLVIGDTNQQRDGFVQEALGNKLGGTDWVTSIHEGRQELVGYGGHETFSISGTNSGFDRHFDIACSRHVVVKIKDKKIVGCDPKELENPNYEPVFIFHGLTDKFTQLNGKAYAYSDHNGVIVEVLRRKNPLAYKAFQRGFIFCRLCDEKLHGIETLTGIHLRCPTPRLTQGTKRKYEESDVDLDSG
ncbi:MAG: hypothetical protein EOO70_02270, partial [Myxococcaceae bacterium]